MFIEPDWTAPIDFESRLAAIPANASARGMFFQLLVQSLGPELAAKQRKRYVAFKMYSMREYVELLALGCREMHPHLPAAERVRRLGRLVYPNYAETMTGTAIFAAAGRSFRRVIELCPAAYRVTTDPGLVSVRTLTKGHAVVELRELWNLPDLHQVGVWEGAMKLCNARGSVRVEVHDLGNVDFEIDWSDAEQ